ncbi:hypothetical protein [Fibrella forsythiae]|uniref:Uncharacterized protein n=1 Tax=Fibrella forsythiae TaxID=2817061 RepID=A0ABS3JR91_9BACT|nr:hypothetical protein [Fibrella forsythiae]MBO0952522.1 hypothetical protein [Fibrella forsythiae]
MTQIARLRQVSSHFNDGEILPFLFTKEVNWQHVNASRNLTEFNDQVISDWLNVSVKTFGEYKKHQNAFKENVKEQVLLLLLLIKHRLLWGKCKTGR